MTLISALATFERSYCDCAPCRQFCKSGKPGALCPSDLDSIAEFMGLEEPTEGFITTHFDACDDGPGAPTDDFPDGATPAIRPKVQDDGRCIFLGPDDRCQIHKVAPFECSRTMACDPADGAAAMRAMGNSIISSADYVLMWWWLRKQPKS